MKHHRRALISILLVAGCLFALPTQAADEGLRSLPLPSLAVEKEPAPDLGFAPPPPAYPLSPVDQAPFRGARHGFVNTSKGNLVFRVQDLRLAARLPLELNRVYD